MKKRLDTSTITSELRGNSAFFPNYKKDSSPAPSIAELEGVSVPEPVRVPVPPPVPLVPKVRRVIRQRQPFDIYQDQYDRLKKIRDIEKDFVNGRGMSQMVREAIDMYLQKHGSSAK